MPSTFGWLDTDPDQRRRMLEVVDLFREKGTLDELGIGAIRDTVANALFPGTSTLHTRLKYVLFVPWLVRRAAQHGTPSEMGTSFRTLETSLIKSLQRGGERQGVIGNSAGAGLKRMPSLAYWGSLSAWGIHTRGFSPDAYFRQASDRRRLARRTTAADDPEAHTLLPGDWIDPHLPPAPEDLLKATTFALTAEEEQYLSDRITQTQPRSMLAWLTRNQPGNSPDQMWDLDNLGDAPEHLARLIDHGRRFHTVIDGAGLLYHLMLTRASGGGEAEVGSATDALAEWSDGLAAADPFDGWDRADWWATITRYNPQVRPATRDFVNAWFDMARDVDLASSRRAADLITRRERQTKGARARLSSQSALDRWTGVGGRFRLNYRWAVARSHLADLYAAREGS